MKSYKDFNKEFIGDSNISTLIMIGYDNIEKNLYLVKMDIICHISSEVMLTLGVIIN